MKNLPCTDQIFQCVLLLVLSVVFLPTANAQWVNNSPANAEIKWRKSDSPFSEGKVTLFSPLGLVKSWAYDPKTNVLFGSHPRGIIHDLAHEIVRYRVSDNTILEPLKDVGKTERLIIKNRRLIAVGSRRKGCWVVVFDLDSNKRIAKFEPDFEEVESLFCSEVDNDLIYILHGERQQTISQFDIVKGQVVNERSFEELGSLKSITPDGKWLGSRSAAAAFDESTMQIGDVHRFSEEGKIVSPPHFQHWAIREQGKADGIPTALSPRKNKYGLSSYALHPSINLFAESCSLKVGERNKINYRYVIQFSNIQFGNTIAKLVFELPKRSVRREYHGGQYIDAVEDSSTRMTVFDEKDKLAIATIGPNAFVVHLTDSVLAAKPPVPVPPIPKKPEIVDSENGFILARVGEEVAFDVSLTENAEAPIRLRQTPEGLKLKDGAVTWRPTLSDIGVHRLVFEASQDGRFLTHKTELTVTPNYLDLKGTVQKSAISCDGSTLAFLTVARQTGAPDTNHLVIVDTEKREVRQEIKVDFNYFQIAMAVNKDHVFVHSNRSVHQFDIETGNERLLNSKKVDQVSQMYLDQSDRLVVAGRAPYPFPDWAFVFDSASLKPIEDDVRAGLLVPSPYFLKNALGAVNDSPEQPSIRKLVRHFGGVVDLEQNKFISLPKWHPNKMGNFPLPAKVEKRVFPESQYPLLSPRWGKRFAPPEKKYALPIQISVASFGRSNIEGADFVLTPLVDNQNTVITAWRASSKKTRSRRNRVPPRAEEIAVYEQVKKIMGGVNKTPFEIFGRNLYVAGDNLVFYQMPEGFAKKLKYPLTLAVPEVIQIKLGANSKIDFDAVGEQNKAEFSLDRSYEHLAIDKETGVLTIDGLGIQNAWLDQQFPLRQADEKLTAREIRRSLKKSEMLVQDKLNHSKFIGVPVPEGFHPIRFSFTVQVKNTGPVENPPKEGKFRSPHSDFDANSNRACVTIVGLINEKFISRELDNAQREVKSRLAVER